MAKIARNDCGTRSVAFVLALFGVVATLADLEAFGSERGFSLRRAVEGRGWGCHELVFDRPASG